MRSKVALGAALVLLLVSVLRAAEPKAKAAEKVPTRPPAEGSRRAMHAVPEDDLYKSPLNLLLSPDGAVLYAIAEDSNEVVAVGTQDGRVLSSTRVGRWPFGAAISRDGRTLYVSNRESDTVSVLERSADGTLRPLHEFPVGDSPHGLLVDAADEALYVAHTHSDDVGIYDTKTYRELRRLKTGRSPFALALSPDGRRVYVSSMASVPVPFRVPSVLEVTFIDTKSRTVLERRHLPSTVAGQGIAVSPDGLFVVVALALPKNLLPESQIQQGWMVTHGFAVLEARDRGRTAFLLLDEPHRYFADSFGVSFSPDGRRLFVSSSGVDTLNVVDFDAVRKILQIEDGRIGLSDAEVDRISRHLAISNECVLARIPTSHNPKGIAVSPDGETLFVAERLHDTVAVIDAARSSTKASIDLGGPRSSTKLRKGARLFNHGAVSFQNQLSCTTCHPENHVDGLVYDIGLDGMGKDLVDNRTLRGIWDTAPFKWSGKNPTIHRQEGPRAAQLFFRSHGFEEEDTWAVVAFIESLPLLENRFTPKTARLNEFQRRGKALFERGRTTDGRYIPVANRCISCHPAPYYTDRLKHDVGSRAGHDNEASFDTPQLNNIHLQAPYLHDGRCYTLEEIWTVFNPDDTHGQTNDMTKEMLNDLIEYLKTF